MRKRPKGAWWDTQERTQNTASVFFAQTGDAVLPCLLVSIVIEATQDASFAWQTTQCLNLVSDIDG